MRRSSAGGRPSLGPLRVKNDIGSASKPKLRLSSASSNGGGTENRLSGVGSNVYGSGRLSYTGGKRTMTRPSAIPSKIKGMNSGAGRRSSMMSAGRGYDSLKDPRPTSDRSYRDSCMRELVQFLGENCYPHAISLKILHAPTSKDFYKIFEFLMQFLRPRYTVGKKAEEEIPALFKQLGYSFTITKSTMITIGSPHSWPTLLAALIWLKRSVQYLCSTDPDRLMYPLRQDSMDFEIDDSQEKLIDSYHFECYHLFMAGDDDFTEHDERFAREFNKSTDGADCESLMAEIRRLKEELQMLKDQPDELSANKDMLHSAQLDVQRMEQYSKELDPHIQKSTAKLKSVEAETLAADTELASIQADIARKQSIYETQELSQNDVKQINAERQQLQRQISTLVGENEAVDKDCWDEEMSFGKTRDGLEGTCEKYNRMAQLLQLIPATAQNAFGIDYELRATSSAAENHKFVSTVKPALVKMRSQCASKVHELKDGCISERDTLEQLQEMLDDKQEQLTQLDAQLQRAEASLETKKEESRCEVAKSQAQHDDLSAQLTQLHQVRSVKVQDAEKQLQHDKAEHEALRHQRAVTEKEMCDLVKRTVLLVVDHKQAIQAAVSEQKQRVSERLRETQLVARDTEQRVAQSYERLETLRMQRVQTKK